MTPQHSLLRLALSMACIGIGITANAQVACVDDPTCAELYQNALSARLEAIYVKYEYSNGKETRNTVDCIDNANCVERAEDTITPVAHVGSVSYASYKNGQGFGVVQTTHTFQGYSHIAAGLSTLELPTQNVNERGFTAEVTAVIPDPGDPHYSRKLTLLTVLNNGNLRWQAYWESGQLYIARRSPEDPHNGDRTIVEQDRPWDTSRAYIASPFPNPGKYIDPNDPFYPLPAGHPLSGPQIVEFYFTFASDGKLRVDLFNVNADYSDQWIEKLIDTGYPVKHYPDQDNNNKWINPTYFDRDQIVVGEKYESDNNRGLLQYSTFERPLPTIEVLAYHKANEFFGGQTKQAVQYMGFGDHPCNTGFYLNAPPPPNPGSQNPPPDGTYVRTPCGQIYGIGQPAS